MRSTAPLPPDRSSESIRTLPMVLSCPICGTPLQGRQTVCSAKCRIARSRRRREDTQQERDAKVRLLLRTVIETAQEATRLLELPLS